MCKSKKNMQIRILIKTNEETNEDQKNERVKWQTSNETNIFILAQHILMNDREPLTTFHSQNGPKFTHHSHEHS